MGSLYTSSHCGRYLSAGVPRKNPFWDGDEVFFLLIILELDIKIFLRKKTDDMYISIY